MKIEIISNPKKDRNFKVTKNLLKILQEYECEIFLPKIKGIEFNSKIKESTPDVKSDIMIVLGGDGSIIRAAKKASLNGTPILGVNLGRVGFLAEVNTNELELVSSIFSGDFLFIASSISSCSCLERSSACFCRASISSRPSKTLFGITLTCSFS